MKNRIALVSLGCPKNQVDAEIMLKKLSDAGYETVSETAGADCIIVNTCGFIESAKSESIAEILAAKETGAKVMVTGCLAQRYSEELLREMPEADGCIGIGANADIVGLVERMLGGERVGEFPPKSGLPLDGKRLRSAPKHYAYIKIAEGCDNRCAYCAIPLIRGDLRCRSAESIIDEAKALAADGVKELIVVAQDTTVYRDENGVELSELLDRLNGVSGIKWIRVLYAYPDHIDEALINSLSHNDKVLKYLDIPMQHASKRVLAAMNRAGDADSLRKVIAALRAKIPDIIIRSTFMVGFPGESEKEFNELLSFLREVKLDRVGCFAFSPEEGTKAADMKNQIPERVKQRRLDALMRLQSSITAEKQREYVNKSIEVICDSFEDGVYICRSRGDTPDIDTNVYVKSETAIAEGEILEVEVYDSDVYDLYAERRR